MNGAKLNGDLIRCVLVIQHVKQQDIAWKLRVTPDYIVQLLNGKRSPSPQLLKKMAKILKVGPELLLLNEPVVGQ